MDIFNFHSVTPGSVRWKMTDIGVLIEGGTVERSVGKPMTVKKVWETYSDLINKFSVQYKVPAELIVACICTESGGKTLALREEPGFVSDTKTPHRISAGLMQTLLSTANEVLYTRKKLKPAKPLTRDFLYLPENSIESGVGYIAAQAKKTFLDPVLVGCAYNAGGVYLNTSPTNRFKLKSYPIGTSHHPDRFILWMNDFFGYLNGETGAPVLPAFSFKNLKS